MQDLPPETPDENAPSPSERVLLHAFLTVLILNAIGVVWLALRSESPPHVRMVLDAIAQTGGGLILTYVGFRALLLYPYRVTDLFVIVMLLSLGMKATIDVLHAFSSIGFLRSNFSGTDNFGEIFQACMVTGSILLIGAAWGLRKCHLLKISTVGMRTLTITAGTLALPAAAGVFAFPVLLLRFVLTGEAQPNPLSLIVLFILSSAITILNLGQMMKTLTLKEEINVKEKMS